MKKFWKTVEIKELENKNLQLQFNYDYKEK